MENKTIIDNERMFLIIKLLDKFEGLARFRNFLTNSKDHKNREAIYYVADNQNDSEIWSNMESKKIYKCAFLDYDKDEIIHLYWSECRKTTEGTSKSLHCRLLYDSDRSDILENFKYGLLFDLKKDYSENSYIHDESSLSIMNQMKSMEKIPYKHPYDSISAGQLNETLHALAQKNEYAKRRFNLTPADDRTEYQRDYDRIIYSRAFRRMVDKAQIFSSNKGDHYRTRMTHTTIVCQIAKNIASQLQLNEDLAEAIAVGHDIGHTPFGHQGERTLHAILTGKKGFEIQNLGLEVDKDDKGDEIKKGYETDRFPYGGFKHNYQSVRVASSLEQQYMEIDGLDLTEQTLNGMWLHTKLKEDMVIKDFSEDFLSDKDVCEKDPCPFTLEGQVVAIADEIAQRSHDIDDAFSSNLITYKELQEHLELKKMSYLKNRVEKINNTMKSLKEKQRCFIDEDQMMNTQVSKAIVTHLIQDVCTQSKENIKKELPKLIEEFKTNGHHVNKRLIDFSQEGKQMCRYLENLITKKVINSHEVRLFDQNASNVVYTLFSAYYQNPMLLHNGTLQRIWKEYRTQGWYIVDFKEGKPELIKDMWNEITQTKISANPKKRTKLENELLAKRKILVRSICDFISGMTDNYALNEYNKILRR